LRDTVSAEVVGVLDRLLAKAPADRFRSATQAAEALTPDAATPAPRLPRRTVPHRAAMYVAVALAAAAVGIWFLSGTLRPNRAGQGPTLAVLPFENLGPASEEYFADGITDEITARLAGIAGLSIIARQSAVQYKKSPKTPQQIGSELGVDYLLEATVSWQRSEDGTSRVRVRPQLIKTTDATHVWADIYDENLTEVFEVQTNIAEEVSEALGVALLAPDRQTLDVIPTDDLQAYDFYLQGNEYIKRTISEEHLQVAESMYGQAFELDAKFALAAAQLSKVHSWMYWYYYDRTEERLTKAREAVDKALAIAPDLPEVHLALGELYYRGPLDYDRALEEFSIAARQRPDDSQVLQDIALVQRRQGKWQQAAETLARVSQLEPRNASNALQAGITYLFLDDYQEAERHFGRAMAFAPDQIRPYVWLARVHLSWRGDTARAREFIQEADRVDPRVLDPQAWWHWALFRILDGPSERTMERLAQLNVSRGQQTPVDSAFYYLSTAGLYDLRDQVELAQAHYDSVRLVLEPRVAQQPNEARFHSDLGIAYAGLGRNREAAEQGELAVRLLPISQEAILGPDQVMKLAQIYVMVGEYDAATERLEYLLSIPWWISHHWLRLDPLWEPLRDHPRFQALLEQFDSGER
jgi:serine/threonine-protein kinase